MNIFQRYCLSALMILANTTAHADSTNTMLTLRTNAFQNNMVMPTLYTCDGKNIPPELSWHNAPKNTATYAIVMSDPDAPETTFYHWILFNIPKSITELSENAVTPAGATIGKNNFNKNDYSGPCPPKGNLHHYIFTLYALDSKLSIANDASPQDVLNAMKNHVISQTELVGMYSRWVQ